LKERRRRWRRRKRMVVELFEKRRLRDGGVIHREDGMQKGGCSG
jgi:hypothetical protein